MNYHDFCNTILAKMEERLKPGDKAILEKVQKNNGLTLMALVIQPETKVTVFPVIYLEAFYELYQKGYSLEEVLEQICDIYEKPLLPDFDPHFFMEYENVKDTIMFKLISYEKNRELLEVVPHVKWEDLAIVFYSLIEEEKIGRGTILIRNEHIEKWHIDCQELYADALHNTPAKLGDHLYPLRELVKELGTEKLLEEMDNLEKNVDIAPMFVLTNEWRQYGAATAIYSKEIQRIAEQFQSNVFLIPSSIHEWILIPDCGKNVESDSLQEIIKQVNETKVALEEVLSDCLYYYELATGKIALFS